MAKALWFLLLFALTNASLLLLYPFSLGRLVLVAVSSVPAPSSSS